MEKKKIVIVGAGITGLTAGVYALKAGFQVEIYEKHSIVGGECTGWDREGYHIDNCIHWMMGTTKGTALNKIWQEVGAIDDDVEIIQSDHMYTSELKNEKLTLWQDINRTEKELLDLSPEDEKEIKDLIEAIKMSQHIQIPSEKPPEMMNLVDVIKMLVTMGDALKLFKKYRGIDTQDLMNRFKHPLIRCLISDFCTKESQAQSFPMAYGNFVGGDGGIPKGGSRAMAHRMGKRFESLGGKIYTKTSVTKIVREGEQATAIKLENGKEVEADYIICTCDPHYIFNQLLDPTYMDDVFKEIYANRKAYPVYGMFQVAYAVDSDKDVLGGDVILTCELMQIADWMNDRISVKTYDYEPSFAPEGKQIIQVLLGLQEEGYDYWKELYQNKEAYQHKKQEIAKEIQQKLEARFPEYKGKMSILDSWTPMTYERYCNAFKGYNQAFMPTKYSRKNPYPSPYLKGIQNVVLAGQWFAAPGGLPGAAIQGKYAVQRVLKKEKQSQKKKKRNLEA